MTGHLAFDWYRVKAQPRRRRARRMTRLDPGEPLGSTAEPRIEEAVHHGLLEEWMLSR